MRTVVSNLGGRKTISIRTEIYSRLAELAGKTERSVLQCAEKGLEVFLNQYQETWIKLAEQEREVLGGMQ